MKKRRRGLKRKLTLRNRKTMHDLLKRCTGPKWANRRSEKWKLFVRVWWLSTPGSQVASEQSTLPLILRLPIVEVSSMDEGCLIETILAISLKVTFLMEIIAYRTIRLVIERRSIGRWRILWYLRKSPNVKYRSRTILLNNARSEDIHEVHLIHTLHTILADIEAFNLKTGKIIRDRVHWLIECLILNLMNLTAKTVCIVFAIKQGK